MSIPLVTEIAFSQSDFDEGSHTLDRLPTTVPDDLPPLFSEHSGLLAESDPRLQLAQACAQLAKFKHNPPHASAEEIAAIFDTLRNINKQIDGYNIAVALFHEVNRDFLYLHDETFPAFHLTIVEHLSKASDYNHYLQNHDRINQRTKELSDQLIELHDKTIQTPSAHSRLIRQHFKGLAKLFKYDLDLISKCHMIEHHLRNHENPCGLDALINDVAQQIRALTVDHSLVTSFQRRHNSIGQV